MTLFQTLKRNAKYSLRGNWGKAAAAPLPLVFCWLILAGLRQYALRLFTVAPEAAEGMTVAGLLANRMSLPEIVILSAFVAASVLLEAPLLLGIMKWHYRLAEGVPVPYTEIFCFFDSAKLYCKAIWLFITLSVRAFLWAFLFFSLPGAMLGMSAALINRRLAFLEEQSRASSAIGGLALFVSVLLMVAALILYAGFMNRYTLGLYMFFEEPGARITALLRRSVRYSHGYRMNMLGFFLTFIGWFLLCVFIAPLFYAVPYCLASMSMYARYVIERRTREETDVSEHTREFTVEDQSYTPDPEPEPEHLPEQEPPNLFPQNRYMETVNTPEPETTAGQHTQTPEGEDGQWQG
ncbi:MAG: DUF975 family protein [Oscillospiraceae bacterium]|nr:DUF975 family protein [Oscillospiraceae bacterium]